MYAIPCRARILGAAFLVALLSSQAADAQVGFDPWARQQPAGEPVRLGTGVTYDIANQAKAEQRLGYLQGKIARDEERGHVAATERDARQIENLRHRIAVDEWLIRKNLLVEPGCYPWPTRIDALSCAAISQYRRPPHVHYGP